MTSSEDSPRGGAQPEDCAFCPECDAIINHAPTCSFRGREIGANLASEPPAVAANAGPEETLRGLAPALNTPTFGKLLEKLDEIGADVGRYERENMALTAECAALRSSVEVAERERLEEIQRAEKAEVSVVRWEVLGASIRDECAALRATLEEEKARLDWWFRTGLTDSVCDGSVDLWWADDQHEVERVTHGVSVRDALDKAMRGIHEPDDNAAAAVSSEKREPSDG